MARPLPLVTLLLLLAFRRWRDSRADQQSDSGADREAQPDRPDQRRRAPARHTEAPACRSGRPAGRLRAREFRARPSRRPPVRQRLARAAVSARSQQPTVRVCQRRRRIPARRLQPARERVHRVRVPSGLRTERVVLHGARRTRDGQPDDAELHSAGIHAGRRDLPQHHHGVARHEPRVKHLRGQQARTAPRRPRRQQPDAPVRRCRIRPDGEAW